MAWPLIARLHDYLLGDKARLGEDWAVVDHLAATQPRARANWWLPMLAVLLAFALLTFHWVWATAQMGWPGMLFRIFVLDYTLFFFGLLSGYDMARRWRTNPEMIEELSLTPLPPMAVASALVAAPCAVWWRVLVGLAFLECLLPVPHFAWLMDEDHATGLGVQLGDVGHLPLMAFCIFTALTLPWVLAWFHYESVRLAHWMFVVHAIPRVSLIGAGISNFIAMTFAVGLLSGVGSAVTGVAMMLVMLVVASVLGMMNVGGQYSLGVAGWYSTWGLSAVAGAIVVALIKRAVARLYIDAFTRSWLLYVWWGAAERTQPSVYPPTMRARLPLWEAYFGMVAERNAEVPMAKRYKTAYYKALMTAHQPGTPKAPVAPAPRLVPPPPVRPDGLPLPPAPPLTNARQVLGDDFLAPPVAPAVTPPTPPALSVEQPAANQALDDIAAGPAHAAMDNHAPVPSMGHADCAPPPMPTRSPESPT